MLEKEIDIDSMIYPMRYDIIIRFKFFELYSSDREYYRKYEEKLLYDAIKSEYFTWFENVFVVRYYKSILNDKKAIRLAFLNLLMFSQIFLPKVF